MTEKILGISSSWARREFRLSKRFLVQPSLDFTAQTGSVNLDPEKAVEARKCRWPVLMETFPHSPWPIQSPGQNCPWHIPCCPPSPISSLLSCGILKNPGKLGQGLNGTQFCWVQWAFIAPETSQVNALFLSPSLDTSHCRACIWIFGSHVYLFT